MKCINCKKFVWYELKCGKRIGYCPKTGRIDPDERACDEFIPRDRSVSVQRTLTG